MTSSPPIDLSDDNDAQPSEQPGLFSRFSGLFRRKPDPNIRETLEEYIGDDNNHEDEKSVSAHERLLISNVLTLQDMEVEDVMIPRADIMALDANTTHTELLALLADMQFSRLPVFQDNLDDVLGTIHIKDVLAALAQGKKVKIRDMIRAVPIVSPSMPVLDLLLHMRESRKHMAMVVDEYGGIDGLVTAGDVVESIVGELDDEHDDIGDHPQIIENKDATVTADARIDLGDFEQRFGHMLDEEDHAESDTLGGLVFAIAGRVPVRGEVLKHKKSGMVFEVLEADPRRIHRLNIRNIPAPENAADQ